MCSRWVPHKLTETEKEGRVTWCHHMIERFSGGKSKRVSDIVIGDETWQYQYNPETKLQSTVWVFETLISEVPQSEWRQCFTEWFRRMNSSIDVQ